MISFESKIWVLNDKLNKKLQNENWFLNLQNFQTSTPLNPSVTTPLTLNTGQNQPKFLLPQQQTPHAFLDSSTAQLFFPQQPPATAIGNFGVPFLNTNSVAAIRAALQQQHLPPGMFPAGVALPPGVGQPIQGKNFWVV